MQYQVNILDLEYEALMRAAGFDPNEEFAFMEKARRLRDFPMEAYRAFRASRNERLTDPIEIECVRFQNRRFRGGDEVIAELARTDMRPAWPAEVLSMWANYAPTDDDIEIMRMSSITTWPASIVALGQTRPDDDTPDQKRVLMLGYGTSPRGHKERLMGTQIFNSRIDYIILNGRPEWLWYAAVKNKR